MNELDKISITIC